MGNESLVHAVAHKGAATHALVIGVGRYPHLLDGGGKLLDENQGLGQLTSPPASGRALATWLVKRFQNPEKPLASVRLLLSEKKPKKFNKKDVVPATIDAIAAAVGEWRAAGDDNPQNMLLFFFSGHGIGYGSMLSLLCEDFGKDPANALDGAIDVQRFRTAMNRCEAKQQCFFIDACRSTADVLVYGEGYAGRPLGTPSALKPKKQQPTFYSTMVGAEAHGAKNKPSTFTQALLEALEGAGGDKSQGDWRISTTALQNALGSHMARHDLGQTPPADDLTRFFIHWLHGAPKVPVTVRCEPDAAYPAVKLSCAANGKVLHEREPAPKAWELVLQAGWYAFAANVVKGAAYKPAGAEEYVMPPEQMVPLKVTP